MNIFNFNCFRQPKSTDNYKRTLYRDDEPLKLTIDERIDFLRYLNKYVCDDSKVYMLKTGLCSFDVLNIRVYKGYILFKMRFSTGDKSLCTRLISEYTPDFETDEYSSQRVYYIQMFEQKRDTIKPLYGETMDIIRPLHVINIDVENNKFLISDIEIFI